MSKDKNGRHERQRQHDVRQRAQQLGSKLQAAIAYRNLVGSVLGEIEALKKFEGAGEILGHDTLRALAREGQDLKVRLVATQAMVIERGLAAIGVTGLSLEDAPAPDRAHLPGALPQDCLCAACEELLAKAPSVAPDLEPAVAAGLDVETPGALPGHNSQPPDPSYELRNG